MLGELFRQAGNIVDEICSRRPALPFARAARPPATNFILLAPTRALAR